MDLILFTVFLILSLTLICLGLIKTEHTELSIVCFVFLFLLAMMIINNNIEYKVGTQTNTTFFYPGGNNSLNPDNTTVTTTDIYNTYTANQNLSWSSKTLSGLIGYWLAVASIVGFIACLLGLKKQRYG